MIRGYDARTAFPTATVPAVGEGQASVHASCLPNPEFAPEELVAYEAGYRLRPASSVFVSFSAFYNQLDDVLSTEALPAFQEPAANPARVIVPVTFGNGLHGSSYGTEISTDVRATDWWRWTANYSYVRIQLSRKPGSLDASQERRNEGLSPRHQLQLRSSVDLPGGWSLDALARHVSELPAGPVPAYTTADVRLSWQVTPQLELAVNGQDLADDRHVEWPSAGGNIGIRRSVFAGLTWRR
jgi:iron complex outermembrane receptor protein